MIEALHAGSQTRQVGYVAQKADVAGQRAQQARTGDTVSISGTGKLVSGLFADMGVDYAPGKGVSLSDIEAGLQENREALDRDIKAMFAENGINVPPEAQLASDGKGHVRVVGDHPQADEIERLFSENPTLENDFRRVSAMSSLVEAGHAHMDFAKEYDENPYAAVARYGDRLFGQKAADDFIMTVGASSASTASSSSSSDGAAQETAASADSAATAASASGRAAASSTMDFTNATRKDLFDWMNEEIRGGRMTLEESSPFLAMTLKISVATGQPERMETDGTRIDFTKKARQGLKAATARNDVATAQKLRGALDIMNAYAGRGAAAIAGEDADA